jgi:hypothetical protein
MTTKYGHIKLGRAFRPHVLAALKGLNTWPAYMTGKGWNGRSSVITGDDIRTACEDLGFDLNEAFVAFFSSASNAVVDHNAAINAERANDEESDEMDREKSIAPPPVASSPAAVETIESEGYEGKDADALIAEALAPASPHMTPHLAQMLPGLVRPFVDAATRGPRVIIKTVVRNVSGDAESALNAPVVNVVKQSALGQAFGLRKSDAPMVYRHALEHVRLDVCNYDQAPEIDRDYVWNVEALCQLAAADACGMNPWLFGHAGTGKTEGVRQYAARLGRPFTRIAIERTTEPQELIGQEVPRKGGGMEWRDGKLTRAFRIPHCVILIDEPTLLRSGSLAVLQTALDMRELHLSTGEIVRAADGVLIVAADNTAGNGDDSGRYVDTAAVNVAFMDRFAFRVEFSYLPPGQETSMLANRTGILAQASKIMVDYAGLTRSNADAGKLTIGLTPRRLLCWAKGVKAGIPSAKAFHSCVVASAAPEDREAILMLEAQSLRSQHATIDGLTRGTIDPNAPDPVEPVPMSEVALKFPDDNDTL